MYVVGLDRSWLRTPYLFHHRIIQSEEDIERFKRNGIRTVLIDTTRGVNVESDPAVTAQGPVVTQDKEADAAPIGQLEPRPPSAAAVALRPLVQELEAARTIHEEALATAQSIFDGVGGGAPLNSQAAKQVVTNLIGTISRSPEANVLLLQLRRFQKDLFTHAVNVCVLSLVVATLDGLESDAAALGMGALLHDIGETRIPRNLIRKRESLTYSEQRLVEQHPKLSVMLLQRHGDVPALARRIALEHHERIDGSGYPNKTQGDDICMSSQIVAITDLYDDMLSGRNQTALQPIEVLRRMYLRSNDGALDRNLIEKFIRCLGVYPIGSLVELNTGERGIVIAANKADSLKPTVRIISSRTGALRPKGPLVNLCDSASGAGERRIVKALDPGKERLDPMMFLKLAQAIGG
jgi:HD-GYP domain-containing protein (c-di-GMP phosphodiesterase class II)